MKNVCVCVCFQAPAILNATRVAATVRDRITAITAFTTSSSSKTTPGEKRSFEQSALCKHCSAGGCWLRHVQKIILLFWLVCLLFSTKAKVACLFFFSLDTVVLRPRRSSSKRSHWFKPNKRDTCSFVLVFILFFNLLIQDPSPWDPPGTKSAVIAFVLVGLCTNQRQNGFVHVVIRPLLEVRRWGPAPFALLSPLVACYLLACLWKHDGRRSLLGLFPVSQSTPFFIERTKVVYFKPRRHFIVESREVLVLTIDTIFS